MPTETSPTFIPLCSPSPLFPPRSPPTLVPIRKEQVFKSYQLNMAQQEEIRPGKKTSHQDCAKQPSRQKRVHPKAGKRIRDTPISTERSPPKTRKPTILTYM